MRKERKFEQLELRVEFCSREDSYRSTHTINLPASVSQPTGDFLALVKTHWKDKLPLLNEGLLSLMCVNCRGKTFSLVIKCYLPSTKLRSAKIDSVLADILWCWYFLFYICWSTCNCYPALVFTHSKMISIILSEPVIYFYGKANSGKTLTLLKLADLFAPYYECIHFYTPNRAKSYRNLIKAENVFIHTVSTEEMLFNKLAKVEKECLILVDDLTLLITGLPAWKSLDTRLQGLKYKKLILSMYANPHVLDLKHNLPVFRCDRKKNNQVSLLHKKEELLLDEVIMYMNRRLVLDDYCNTM